VRNSGRQSSPIRRTAPLPAKLAATLVFSEKLTLRPKELSRADADVVFATGVTHQALRDACSA
jgi:hypothetical protein